MAYESIHGKGGSNCSSSCLHRMPTVSAADALQNLNSSSTRCISTGLRYLDSLLQNREGASPAGEPLYGGVSRGKVTEIYGPPGVGKTSIGMQLAAGVLRAGEGVIWVDGSHPLCGPRFSQILACFHPLSPPATQHPSSNVCQSQSDIASDLLHNLNHFSTPTLAHLIALISHSSKSFVTANTSLMVIDGLSSIISSAFPQVSSSLRKPGDPNPSPRKFSILQYLVNSLQKLAATQNIAIVVLSQCMTKMRLGDGAVLIPAINSAAWEQGISCRVALFRDWGCDDDEETPVNDVRVVEVMKAEGFEVPEGRRNLAGFAIGKDGFTAISILSPQSPRQPMPPPPNETAIAVPQKRKFSATKPEIPDSEGEDDEDYGWAEEDEEDIPPMPPQWQGSEDIMAPPESDLEADEEETEVDVVDVVDVGENHEMEIGDSEDELAL